MAKLSRRWLNTTFLDSEALRAQDIPYDSNTSIRDILDEMRATPSYIIAFGGTSETSSYWSTNNDTYTTAARFIFRGTTAVGSPTRMKAVVQATTSGSTQLRLYDATNAQTIGEITGITSTSDINIETDSSLTNLPTGEAVFEIQANDQNSIAMFLYTFQLEFD